MIDGVTPDDRLTEALRESQRLGMLGARPIPDVIEHARSFVAALADVHGRVLDLGSGGGVPGLVIATDRPDLVVTLLDRRRTRMDAVERLVHRLDMTERVAVMAADAADVVRSVGRGLIDPFDAVVARGFGPPEVTLRLALGLVATGGRIVISEPPSGDRWAPELLDELGVELERMGPVAVFRRLAPGRTS